MMKKFLRFVPLMVLCLALLLLLLPQQANAASTGDLTFTLNSDGESYSVTDCKQSASGELIIPATYGGNPVTGIGEYAFSHCSCLTSITIPDSVTSIGDDAFSSCTGLTSINIGTGVTRIGNYAFRFCDSLTSVTIPDSVISIGTQAFGWCDSLTYISMGGGVTSIDESAFYGSPNLVFNIYENAKYLGNTSNPYTVFVKHTGNTSTCEIHPETKLIGAYAFSNCDSLTNITIPDSVTSIDDGAFNGCSNLTSVTIGIGVRSIDYHAFDACTRLTDVYFNGTQTQWDAIAIGSYNEPLTNATLHISPLAFRLNADSVSYSIIRCDASATGELVIPSAYNGLPVTEIGASTFYSCTGLTGVTIPDGVTSIGDKAFYNCTGLTSITIPDSVTSIGYEAFYNCTGIKQIQLPKNITEISKSMFYQCTALKQIVIPEGVKAIADKAFYHCSKLSEVTIPDSVTYIGSHAFNRCGALKQVQIPESVAVIGEYAFYKCNNLSKVNIPEGVDSIEQFTFGDCASLTEIHIPDGVKTIGDSAFVGCACLTSVTIPDDVITIGDSAFKDCTGLVEVFVPRSITSVGTNAFKGCTILTNVYYNGTRQQWNSIVFADGNLQLTNANIIFNAAYLLKYEVKDGVAVVVGCDTSAAGRLSIPATYEGYPVTAIGNRAFYNCSQLTNVVIPDSVTSIGNGAFSGCWYLAEVTVPDSVESIGFSAFYNCFNLKSFRVPANITAISNSMLEDCFTLEELILPEGLESIGYYAFSGCESLENVSIPATVTDIQNSAFAKCYSLRSVTIPSGITDIDYSVFEACQNLEMVTLPSSVTAINTYAFDGCTALENVYFKGTRSQWSRLSVGEHNDALTVADVHCNPLELQNDHALLVTEDGLADHVLVSVDQVLDLNGHVLTADSLASFGQIIDSVGGGGLIVGDLEITGNDWLPIQDETGCYRFYQYEVENLGTKADSDSVTFGFTMDFADVAAYGDLLKTGDVQITVTLAWGENVKTFAFSRELIAEYVALVEKYPGLRPYLKLDVTGLDSLEDGTKLIVIPAITAVGGKMQNTGNEMTYTA